MSWVKISTGQILANLTAKVYPLAMSAKISLLRYRRHAMSFILHVYYVTGVCTVHVHMCICLKI